MLLRSVAPRAARSRRLAFTLLEILIVVAIIVILAGVGIVYLVPQLTKSEEGVAKAKANAIAGACQIYYNNHHAWPQNVEELTQPDPENDNKPYITDDGAKDPWGNFYTIDASGPNHKGAAPDVYTTSPSGKVIGNWGK
jgi:general secretion pathway protein G